MTKTKVSRFWRPSWVSNFHGLRLRRMRKVLKSVFPFQVLFPFVRYKILLRLSIILYVVSLFLLLFFLRKRRCSLSKRCWKELSVFEPVICSSVLQLEFPWHWNVNKSSLSDHKAACTFCVSQERGIVKRMVWSRRSEGAAGVSETKERSEKYV